MSISQTINVSTLGTVVTNQGGIDFTILTPTGTLGVISTTNPDGLSAETGLRSVLVNVPCSAYQGSLNSASLFFRTNQSYLYSTPQSRPPFASVSNEDELFALQTQADTNGLQVNDYVVFVADDLTSDYRE